MIVFKVYVIMHSKKVDHAYITPWEVIANSNY